MAAFSEVSVLFLSLPALHFKALQFLWAHHKNLGIGLSITTLVLSPYSQLGASCVFLPVQSEAGSTEAFESGWHWNNLLWGDKSLLQGGREGLTFSPAELTIQNLYNCTHPIFSIYKEKLNPSVMFWQT